MKNLTTDQAKQQLKMGRPIEQWLGHLTEEAYRSLKWLRIDKENDGSFSIAKFECFDDGSPDFLDIYAFGAVDPDLAYGDIVNAATAEEALEKAQEVFGAEASKYVGSGMIQDSYAEFLKEHGEFTVKS